MRGFEAVARAPLLAVAACAVVLTAPALADEADGIALRRLRACVTAGAGGAPRGSLGEAVSAVRALCRPQIDRARTAEDRRISAENPRASASRLAALQDQARRKLDYDLAMLVHHMTGAQP